MYQAYKPSRSQLKYSKDFVSAGHSSGDGKCIVSPALGPSAILMADGNKE